MRHGGMGLHCLSPAEGFSASAALANVAMTGAPEQFRPFDGPAGAGLRQESSQLCTHVGLSNPCGEVVDAVCLRMVLTQAQKDTSRATTGSRLWSITALNNGSSPLKRAQEHKAGTLSCASRMSSIWLTALPIHNALALSNGAFCNAFQFRLGLSPRPMHAAAGPSLIPLQAHPIRLLSARSKAPPARHCTVSASQYSLWNLVLGHAICWGAHLT